MEDIVRQSEGRRAERPRSSARRAAKEAAKEASREVVATRIEGSNVIRLGVGRLATLVTNRFPKLAPEPEPADEASSEALGTRMRLPQADDAKSWTMRISFAVCVALPTVLAMLYYGLIAADQFVAEFRFSVRPGEARLISGSGSAAPGGGGAAALAAIDNFIVVDYVRSRQAVDALERDVGLKKVYATEHADFLSRLAGDISTEGLVKYWGSMIDSAFDITSGIAVVKIRAFTPEDAQKVATRLMQLSEALVNDVNSRSRRDAIRFAEEDLRRAEDRLKGARRALRDFRSSIKAPDPAKDAEATFVLVSKMREQIAQYNTELFRSLGSMSQTAPTVVVLRDKIRATEDQIKQIEGRFGESTGAKDLLPAQLAQYEDLEVDRLLAEKLYGAVLETVETARSNANMQHTYVAAFVEPGLPEKPLYPQRLLSILIVLVASLGLWCAGMMMVYAVKDHSGR